MVASNIASVNRSRRRGDIARDSFDRDITIEDDDRSLFVKPSAGDSIIDIWGDAPTSKPKSPAANENAKSHDAVLSGNAGFVVSVADFVDRLLADGEIEQQSRIVAEKLKIAGWNPYLKSESQVVLIGTVTGAIRDAASNYRNCNIIPAVAKRNRAEILGEFRLFLSENGNARRYSRYLVVTSGKRFPFERLAEQYERFSERLGRFLERADEWSVEVYLTTIEMTFDDEGTVNLHANIVYRPKEVFGMERWKDWLDFVREHFDTVIIKDCGRVREPAEIIKYVCKPAEVLLLTSDQTASLAIALHKKQLVRPVGEFAAWRKALRSSGHKARFDREAGKLVRVQRFTREQQIKTEIEAQNREDALAEARREGRIRKDEPAGTGGDLESDPVENQILCTTLPQARSHRLAETYVVVRNYTPVPNTQNGRRGLEALDRRRVHYINMLARNRVAREIVKQAGSPVSILDTLTIIPPSLFLDLPKLSEKRRKRLLERLHLPDGSPLAFFAQALRTRLQRLLPTRCHVWSDDVANIGALYDAETARQDAFRVDQKKARDVGRSLSELDWEDEVIPFAPPLIKYGPPPDLPPPSPVQMPRWEPTPPIIRPAKPAPVPRDPRLPQLRKPAFLTSWCKTGAAA
ncbi:hypothetical protein [Bradyrhizobium sp. SZCCHNPS2010]|uniref:hypothetical protein n=1 Tax=Bradyrhizobium sp. SZCCHNPS2010 TaxID=3057333 RepID=UPI002916C5B1|nr:hypothetical protein [Bradyrhizobium sp. SZCCHNPS2010]